MSHNYCSCSLFHPIHRSFTRFSWRSHSLPLLCTCLFTDSLRFERALATTYSCLALPVLQHHGCNVLRKVAFAFISPSCAKEKMLFLLTPFYFSDYRLSKVYMVTTNLLFACLGFAFIAFGVIGRREGFKGATLFPPNTFKRMWTWLTFSQDNDVFRS